jgi:glutamine amidotransferase
VSDVVIIDNGGGNVASVRFALGRLGVEARLSADAAVVRAARRVILPGVGAAGDAMQRLRAHGLDRVIPTLTQPVLGICLGMQLLFGASDEGDTPCLGVLPGRVLRLVGGSGLRVPNMGWCRLAAAQPSPLLAGLGEEAYAYFVHGYAAPVGPGTVATADHGGPFTAIVSRDNFHGAQCHPERSGATGARLLRNFLDLDG